MPSKLQKAIGAVKDQTSISLAKVSNNNSSNLEVCVLKATTHDDIPIDERYVSEILQLVSSDKTYAASCARAIGKRIGRTRNWIVALKSLMLVLRIFQDGDPYFPREVLHAMKRGAKILNLSSFRNDSNSSPWDFTAFIRTFALYLDERLDCFLTGKLQRRYNNRDRELVNHRSTRRGNEPVRDMKPAMLLDRISYWQRLLDRAIATQPTGASRNNRLVQVSLYAVVQETFDLYKDISDGLALLLDSFFHLQYQSCVHAFQTCVKASKQFEELSVFYTLCKTIGVGRTSEYPSVQTISNELVETLQEFLKDQSSFPATGKSPNRPLLLPAPSNPSPAMSGGAESYGLSEFSEPLSEEMSSEFGSQCKSLEDLISATELTGKRRSSISIDLEAYSFSNQLEKPSQQDDACSQNDAASSKSLPTTASMVDLVSFDELPQSNANEQDKVQEPFESAVSASSGWELVLAGATTSSPAQPLPSVANGSEKKTLESPRDGGWELVLAETATQSTQPLPNVATGLGLDSLYQQTSPLPNFPSHHYNPFLQDTTELKTVTSTVAAPVSTATADVQADSFPASDPFSWAPTFQASPTFCAQNPNGTIMAMQNENDPFGTCSPTTMAGEQMMNGSVNQQNLLHEQQLWLQHQNKIIAKHMA
ncbi:clathrin coat assembly protein AP180 [Cornus florida]|uniref:clathrin coat assembly protein AP180 n=1 Tax=Cornus florida TaxID=4283 RepID=UPI0028980B61|nr:clathrin coat assembly protein AP180 [Cornus florida]